MAINVKKKHARVKIVENIMVDSSHADLPQVRSQRLNVYSAELCN